MSDPAREAFLRSIGIEPIDEFEARIKAEAPMRAAAAAARKAEEDAKRASGEWSALGYGSDQNTWSDREWDEFEAADEESRFVRDHQLYYGFKP